MLRHMVTHEVACAYARRGRWGRAQGAWIACWLRMDRAHCTHGLCADAHVDRAAPGAPGQAARGEPVSSKVRVHGAHVRGACRTGPGRVAHMQCAPGAHVCARGAHVGCAWRAWEVHMAHLVGAHGAMVTHMPRACGTLALGM